MPCTAVLLLVDALVTIAAITTDFSRTGPIACRTRRDEMLVSLRCPFWGEPSTHLYLPT